MKRLLVTLVTAICGAALMSMYLVPTAEAAPYTPKNGVIFNNPAKSRAKERRIETTLDNAVAATPRGATISMVMYLFNDNTMLKRLIAAHKRGVKVQLVIDDGADAPQVKTLKKALGTKKNYNRSFVFQCKRSCMSNYPWSTVHGKVYAFSQVGNAKNVTIISSANPHGVNIYNSWNNSHTIVNNAVMYTAMRQYFTDTTMDRSNYNYGNTFRSSGGGVDRNGIITSGKYQITLFPRRHRSDRLPRRPERRLLPDQIGKRGSYGRADGHVGLHEPPDGRRQAAVGPAQRRLQGRRHHEPGTGQPHDHAPAPGQEQEVRSDAGRGRLEGQEPQRLRRALHPPQGADRQRPTSTARTSGSSGPARRT